MRCQGCGQAVPTRKVRFHCHTGLLVAMRHTQSGGHFCKKCIKELFSRYTRWTALAGWWGVASVFITPLVLMWNTGTYLGARNLPEGDGHADFQK